MPTISVNGCKLYYETYGEARPGVVPVVLIHGSTSTGRKDWGAVAPVLARDYYVIVPDCRGHGQSSNPRHSYSFREMAGDIAALVRGLGYERAHVIGHSNGGNVALVALVEFPAQVQTCIIQAGNAYVSSDLREREPAYFDPARVARDEPAWKKELIELHGPAHGPEYWRELLRLTRDETLSQPNYTEGDLQKVKRPTLVIQGELDPSNAPGRHAQFIARHIPDADLWIPANTGHAVHEERLFEWVTHVADFLARRGDDANDALYRLRRARYPDARETVFDVRARVQADVLTLAGRVLTEEQRLAATAVLPPAPVLDQVRVLLQDAGWGVVNCSVSDLRREPRRLSEQVSQAVMGEVLRILEKGDGWIYARRERDGYLGWIQANTVYPISQEGAESYRRAMNVLVKVPLAEAFETPPEEGTDAPRLKAGALPLGVTLPAVEQREGWTRVRLPDGRAWWVAGEDLVAEGARPEPTAGGMQQALEWMRRTVGVPYQWGGLTPYGYDCSGFAQTLWGLVGVPIPRDADQQFRAGQTVEGDPQPGDLLFFGEDEDPSAAGGWAHITHVAVSLGRGEFIHANGTANGVSYNSFDPNHPLYRAWLKEHLAGVRRFNPRPSSS